MSSTDDESNFKLLEEQQKNAFEIGDAIFANNSDQEKEVKIKKFVKTNSSSSSFSEEEKTTYLGTSRF